ncbi:MAG: nadE [Chlamydiales bacterium]|jgi:NAD+ synthase (glutamine-hydrolysing)|nr:nadE [Chlamydiales bacterium]
MKIALRQFNPTVAKVEFNLKKIIADAEEAISQGADLIVFPEMALTGYPPGDFLLHPAFLTQVEKALQKLQDAALPIAIIVGFPRSEQGKLYNSAAVISHGTWLGFQDKTLLPNYGVFDEKRYFQEAESVQLFTIQGHTLALTICEDIWQCSGQTPLHSYRKDPVHSIKELKTPLSCLINLSASPYTVDKRQTRLHVAKNAASFLNCPLLLVNQVGSLDSLLFDGHSLFIDREGRLIEEVAGFSEGWLFASIEDAAPLSKEILINPLSDLEQALVMGIRDYFQKCGFTKACLGLSGGIDSALVAALAVRALGKENVVGFALPSRYSSKESFDDAENLAKALGIQLEEISIEPLFHAYLDTLSPHFQNKPADVTEENLQARIRGMLLMALANKHGYLVLSTGNKSEWAMGYSTLYGDLVGAISPIGDLLKHEVYHLARHLNHLQPAIPEHTFTRPPSAELAPNQKDSDSLPDYDIVDHVVASYLIDALSPAQIACEFNLPLELVESLIERIHRFEYKRRQAPFAFCVSENSFSAGWRYPITYR